MAQMRISQTFADGSEFEVDCYVDPDFADSVNEVRVHATRAFLELTGLEVE